MTDRLDAPKLRKERRVQEMNKKQCDHYPTFTTTGAFQE